MIIGQVQFPVVQNESTLPDAIADKEEEILALANSAVPGLVQRGGGVRDVLLRSLTRDDGATMMVLHVYCDPCDAMGAKYHQSGLRGPEATPRRVDRRTRGPLHSF